MLRVSLSPSLPPPSRSLLPLVPSSLSLPSSLPLRPPPSRPLSLVSLSLTFLKLALRQSSSVQTSSSAFHGDRAHLCAARTSPDALSCSPAAAAAAADAPSPTERTRLYAAPADSAPVPCGGSADGTADWAAGPGCSLSSPRKDSVGTARQPRRCSPQNSRPATSTRAPTCSETRTDRRRAPGGGLSESPVPRASASGSRSHLAHVFPLAPL